MRAGAPGTVPTIVTVSGTVSDESGVTMPGVNVIEKGTTNGTTTDTAGKYTLTVEGPSSVLVFSFIGYQTQEIAVQAQTSIAVTLASDVATLNEVVVVGYGEQKKVSLTGAVASVRSEELMTTRHQNVQNMMTGKVPGVRVVQRTSEPGNFDTQFDIRGFGAPLIIIDGVPRDNIARIDPSEIESISVLKDASAAIYGVRAANGVVLITTKTGQPGRARIEYSGYYGMQNVIGLPRPVDVIDRYTLANEKSMHTVNGPVLRYTDDDFAPFRDGSRQGTDWYDDVMRNTAPQYQHNLTVSGASEDKRVDYFINLGYMNQQGYYRSDDLNYDRYNVRANIGAQITQRIKASMKISGIVEQKNSPYANQPQDIYGALWRAQPNEQYYANDNSAYLFKTLFLHPGAITDAGISGYRRDDNRWVQSQFQLEYKVPYIEGLLAKGMFSYDMRFNENRQYRKTYTSYAYDPVTEVYIPNLQNAPGNFTRNYYSLPSSLMQLSLNYGRTLFSHHNINLLVLYEESTRKADNFFASRELGLPMDYLFAGKAQNQIGNSNINDIWETANKGLVGRLNYDFKGKYMVDFAFRYDGSSKFPPGKQWGFFPAVFAGWRISEEDFFHFDFVDNLKVRGSWGEMGDDGASSYQFISGYDYPYNGSNQGLPGGHVLGGTFVNSLGFRNSPNPNITWYTVQTANIGLDADFLGGKIGFQFDVFRRNRAGLLANRLVSVPGSFGATMPQENLNSDQTKGLELGLTHRGRAGQVSYTVTGNVSYTRTKNRYIERARAGNSYDNWRNNTNGRYNDVWFGWGDAGQFTSYEEIAHYGVYTSRNTLPGDYRYEDWNGDGVIDDGDRHPIATTLNPASNDVTGGNAKKNNPLLNFGLTLSAAYKGIDLTVLFQGSALSYVANKEMMIEPLAFDGNALEQFMDRWRPEDPKADPYNPATKWIPGYYAYTGTNIDENSERNIQNTAYLRVKTLEIGYTVPRKITARAGVHNLRLFFNGYNLHTWTKARIIDPEHPSELFGYIYPLSSTTNVGLTATF
ncbi:TonB-dependent receptor [Fulvivirgaceae bacterium PWU37]|uniref:TonB-dependent receptor n=2 Tax=Dawidia soli TaxID=2782352 RepID=A0AAP2DD43_9BACT|nr:TonB-dependent receptor [Dawidia soli]